MDIDQVYTWYYFRRNGSELEFFRCSGLKDSVCTIPDRVRVIYLLSNYQSLVIYILQSIVQSIYLSINISSHEFNLFTSISTI